MSKLHRLRFSKNETRTRCICCGALPDLYHSQLCADQNAMRMTEADGDQAVSLYDSKQAFMGFAILPESPSVTSRDADNAWTLKREKALIAFVAKLEDAAAEVVDGPIGATTFKGTRFVKYGFHGEEHEGATPFLVNALELDAVIDEHLETLASHLIKRYMSGAPMRLVWRKRPELRSDGPVSDTDAVRYGRSPRDHAVVWLCMRFAFEPITCLAQSPDVADALAYAFAAEPQRSIVESALAKLAKPKRGGFV